METIIGAIIGAVAALLAAIIPLTRWGKRQGRQERDRELNDAPRMYVEDIGKLIRAGVSEGRDQALINARTIVKVRNDTRNSLISISEQLNSEIDKLESQVNNLEQHSSIFDTIVVLQKAWPSKERQIEVELRKLLAELGIFGKSPEHSSGEPSKSPPVAPPPPASPPAPTVPPASA